MKQFIYVNQPSKAIFLDISQIQSIDIFENTTGEYPDHQRYIEIGVVSNAVFPLYFVDDEALQNFLILLFKDRIDIIKG